MVIKVGLNGFGRVGRVVFRTCLQNPDLEISAINDPAIEADYISYLIKFDSTHGKLTASVSHTEDTVTVNGKTIQVFHEKLPTDIPWKVVGAQYVVEASGMFTTYEKASGHLKNETVKRVIVTAPSLDIPMTILGVNHHKLGTDQRVLSCGSSTLYCLAPIIKVLEDSFGVEDGFITSIHAMTPSLKPLDGLCLRGKHWRDHRSIHQNIIPASTGACKALGRIIPSVRDKMTGLAFRVPIVNVSVLDICVRYAFPKLGHWEASGWEGGTNLFGRSIRIIMIELHLIWSVAERVRGLTMDVSKLLQELIPDELVKPSSIQEIFQSIRTATRGPLRNIIKISTEESVSSDFNRDSHSCIVDGQLCLGLNPNSFKIICWYENEYSYACRVLDSIFFSEKQLSQEAFLSTLTCATTTPMKLDFVLQTQNLKQTEKPPDETCVSKAKNVTEETANVANTLSRQSRSIRALLMRSPSLVRTTSPSNTAAKKDSKIIKIRKDETGSAMFPRRQNKGSLFQPFSVKTTQDLVQSDCAKAQERLEKVKVEFCKMVNITEDLFKKSCKQNNLTKTSSVTFNHQNHNKKCDDTKADANEPLSNQERNSLPTDKVDIIKGINKLSTSTTTSTVDSFTLINDENRCCILNNHNDFSSAPPLHKSPSIKNFTTVEVNKTSSDKTYRVNKLDAIVESSNVSTFYEYDSKDTIDTIRDYLSDKSQLRSLAGNENYIRAALSKAKNYKNEKLYSPVAKPVNIVLPDTEIQNDSLKLCKKETSKVSLNFFRNKSSLHAIEKELRKRNIVLVSEEAQKRQFKDNEPKVNEHTNRAVYCCQGSAYTGGYKNLLSSTLDSTNKHCSRLRSKLETDKTNSVSERKINNDAYDTIVKSDEGDDNKLSKTNEQKDSDYETDNFSVKTDLQKEKNFEGCSTTSNTLTLNTENNVENVEKFLYDNSKYVNNDKTDKANSQDKISNEIILLHDDYNNSYEKFDNLQSNMGENSARGSPEIFLHEEVHSTDKKKSHEFSGCTKEYSMTRAEDMRDLNVTLRAEESHPSMYSGTSNPPTRPDSARQKQDIYDKLDSVSASDSDCSSHIDGKKSQVIHITDLTNSLEDLERLDKICRIVEISDELSDKLFSRLDSGDSHAKFTTKKWSFKDLCEKINLDEFCNKVFGQVEV